MEKKDYKLCYVEKFIENGYFQLFFTSDMEKQWGDDWNDTPAESNAGEPYDDEDTDVFDILIYGDILTFTSNVDYLGSKHSAQVCNEIGWLIVEHDDKMIMFKGGETYNDIVTKCLENDICIYTKESEVK